MGRLSGATLPWWRSTRRWPPRGPDLGETHPKRRRYWEIGAAAERGGADAVVAINTVKAMRISTALRRPVLGTGLARLWEGDLPHRGPVRLRLYEAAPSRSSGAAGSTADNVVEMMMAGASAVEIRERYRRYRASLHDCKGPLQPRQVSTHARSWVRPWMSRCPRGYQ